MASSDLKPDESFTEKKKKEEEVKSNLWLPSPATARKSLGCLGDAESSGPALRSPFTVQKSDGRRG